MVKFKKEKFRKALIDSAGNVSIVAQRMNMSRNAIYENLAKDTELVAMLQQAKDEFIDFAENKLVESVKKGDWKAIEFTLRTIGKNRGYAERQEITHQGSQPVHIVFEDNDADCKSQEITKTKDSLEPSQ